MKKYVRRLFLEANPSDDTRGGGENPYLSARREWNERYGSYIAQAHSWRLVSLLSLTVTLLTVAGLAWMAGQTRLVPYVVEVDKLGSAVAVQRADVAGQPDPRIIDAQLARWGHRHAERVHGCRRRACPRHRRLRHGQPAITGIRRHQRVHAGRTTHSSGPKKETVSVEVQSVLPISKDTWRLEWREDVRGRDGALAKSQQ